MADKPVKVLVNFTPKLGGVAKVPPREFDGATTVASLQNQLASKVIQGNRRGQPLYLFVNDSFIPTPDQTLENLMELFGNPPDAQGKRSLSISYCLQVFQG